MIVMKVGDMVMVNIGNDNFYCEKETGADIWEEKARYIDSVNTLFVNQEECEELSSDIMQLTKKFQEKGKTIKYVTEEEYVVNKEEVYFYITNL